MRRILVLTAIAFAAAPAVTAQARTEPTQCQAWSSAMHSTLALYGIEGQRADDYLAQRADNPCHAPITLRSLFHAGDPS